MIESRCGHLKTVMPNSFAVFASYIMKKRPNLPLEQFTSAVHRDRIAKVILSFGDEC